MLGVGGIAAVPATRWLGRLPVLFWSMTIAFFMSIFAAAAPGWISYIVARCLQGFFVTAPQVVGLSMLHDMFFFHGMPTLNLSIHGHTELTIRAEHARKIGIWAGTFIFSPYLGPFLSGIINNYCGWRVSTWVCVAIQGIGVILVILLADETYYDTGTSKRYTADVASGKSKWRIQCEKLVGVTGYQAHYKGVGKTMTALLIMVLRPHFVALCCTYSNVSDSLPPIIVFSRLGHKR
jgi:MFS family permease